MCIRDSDSAGPQRLARFPARREDDRLCRYIAAGAPTDAVAQGQRIDGRRAIATLAIAEAQMVAADLNRVGLIAERDSAQAVTRDALPAHLAGNFPLALAEHMIDRDRDDGEHFGPLTLRLMRVEAFGEFLGDEAGGELAGAPARMRHHRRQERDVVADAIDHE